MNKTLEALLRGYILFCVNGKYFLRYNTARDARVATIGDVEFKGWHIFKGWRCFFLRVTPKPAAEFTANPFFKMPDVKASAEK